VGSAEIQVLRVGYRWFARSSTAMETKTVGEEGDVGYNVSSDCKAVAWESLQD
jgi:hypothetical protein